MGDHSGLADLSRHIDEWGGRVDGRFKAIDGKIGDVSHDLGCRLTDIEQKLARRPGGGGSSLETKTLGRQAVESTEFKSFLESPDKRGRVSTAIERKNITSAGGSGAALVAPDYRVAQPIGLPQQRLTIRDVVAPGTTDSNAIYFVQQVTRNLNAATVAEGALKPQSDLTFQPLVGQVRTLAHWFQASRQIMDDAAGLASLIDSEARYGLALLEEAQMLYGDGNGQNLSGMVPQATKFVAPYAATGTTNIDVILQAATQAELAKLPATAAIVNHLDWAKLIATKDGQGRYIVGDPLSGGYLARDLWGLQIVPSLSMTQGTFLVGNFAQNVQIFDRQAINVVLSTEDQDNFVKNMVTILAEERLAMIVKRPAALITGTFPTS